MKAEEKLFNSLDRGIDEFFARNPSDDDVKKTKAYITNLINQKEYGFAIAGLKYVLARLGGGT